MSIPSSQDDSSLAWEVLSKRLEGLTLQLQKTEKSIDTTVATQEESIRKISRSFDDFRSRLKSLQVELDRSSDFSKNTISALGERFANFEKRFVVLDKHLELIQADINRLRDADLAGIHKEVQKCPSIESLTTALSNSESPLATKAVLSELSKTVYELKGALDSYFKFNLAAIFLTLITVLLSVLGGYAVFSSKLTPSVPPNQTPSSTP